jgi:uncharacterized protein (DUF1330 family)
MAFYKIAQGRTRDKQKHDEYVAKSIPTLPLEARVLAFAPDLEEVERPVTHPRTVILGFPAREAAACDRCARFVLTNFCTAVRAAALEWAALACYAATAIAQGAPATRQAVDH